MLRVEDLHVYYGEIHALKGVSLTVGAGEIVAVLGPNGAGKTTTVKTISGLLVPRRGKVILEEEPLTGFAAHEIVSKGVAHVPEGRKIFNRLTVAENLGMGAYIRTDGGIAEDTERVFALFPRLKERRTQVAGTLSGGEQQMLAIGRALMARPRLLLLDEPSMGRPMWWSRFEKIDDSTGPPPHHDPLVERSAWPRHRPSGYVWKRRRPLPGTAASGGQCRRARATGE